MIDPQDDDARDLFGRSVESSVPSGRQLPLPLAWRGGPPEDSPFLIGTSNEEAVRHILSPDPWPSPASIVIGPAGSGRSTLARIFVAQELGESVDGLATTDEEALFHAWNRARDAQGKLLIIADAAEDIAAVTLPDLATRLATAPRFVIEVPDLCLTRDLVAQLLIQRGLNPPSQLGAYVAARIERSYAAIHAAVAAIDAAALAAGTGASIATARAALIEAGLYDPAERTTDSPETP